MLTYKERVYYSSLITCLAMIASFSAVIGAFEALVAFGVKLPYASVSVLLKLGAFAWLWAAIAFFWEGSKRKWAWTGFDGLIWAVAALSLCAAIAIFTSEKSSPTSAAGLGSIAWFMLTGSCIYMSGSESRKSMSW